MFTGVLIVILVFDCNLLVFVCGLLVFICVYMHGIGVQSQLLEYVGVLCVILVFISVVIVHVGA